MTIQFAHLDEMMRIVPDTEGGCGECAGDDCACSDCACTDCANDTQSAQIEATDRELSETIWIERGTGWEPVTLMPRALLRRGEHANAGR
jgi:hypothetical protein